MKRYILKTVFRADPLAIGVQFVDLEKASTSDFDQWLRNVAVLANLHMFYDQVCAPLPMESNVDRWMAIMKLAILAREHDIEETRITKNLYTAEQVQGLINGQR
jgi:hypothetical protein